MSHEDKGWEKISRYSITKQCGGMHNFMHSYGIKPYDADAYDEANQIIDETGRLGSHECRPASGGGSSLREGPR